MIEQDNSHINMFFIDSDKYFKVDEDGRTLPSETFEGTLGFVIKVYSVTADAAHFALKIPKLHGATHRENSYIIELMELEAFAAIQVGGKVGLVKADADPKLRRLLATEGSIKEVARMQNGGFYLIEYEPGKNPRFELLLPDEAEAKGYDWGIIIEESKRDGEARYKSSIFTQHKTLATSSNQIIEDRERLYFDHLEAAGIYSAKNTQYAFLPAVLYTWANGTLQDAITRQAKGKWDIYKHLEFIQNISQAVYNLHVNGFIHADIRPANIMYLGDTVDDTENAPKRPASYLLGDYGSFASVSPDFMEAFTIQSGETKLARTFEGERISEFYAPERISGTERETVDKAFIFKPNEGGSNLKNLWVVLGLKNQAAMKDKEAIVSILQEREKLGDENISEDIDMNVDDREDVLKNRLLRHDRIQIQNYIFELAEAEIFQNGLQILRCKLPPTQIVQKRIAIKVDHTQIPAELAIDRIIELLQWGAAVDLYSIGVLMLYTIFMDQFQEIEDSDLNTIMIKNAEDRFRGMINILSNREYFITLWPQLEAFRHGFDTNQEDPNLANEEFENEMYDVSSEDDDVTNQEGNFRKGTDFKEFAIGLTMRVTAYVPGAKQLLEQLDNNVALFLLILHFISCCIHRKDHIVKKALRDWMVHKEGETIMPFSSDRTEDVKDLSISKVIDRIEDLRKSVNKNSISGFVLDSTDIQKIPDFNPGNPGMILFDKVQLESKIKGLQGSFLKEVQKSKTSISQKVDEIQSNATLAKNTTKYQNIKATIEKFDTSMSSRIGKWGVSEDDKKLIPELKDLLGDYRSLNNEHEADYEQLAEQYKTFLHQMSQEIDNALKQYGQRESS